MVGVALLFATGPDVDLHVLELVHRGLTHTVWAALAVGGLTTVAGEVVARATAPETGDRRRWSLRVTPANGGLTGGVAVGCHLLGDVLTPLGIRPFAPFVAAEYSLALVTAREPTANRVLFAAGVLAMTIALLRGFSNGGRVSRTARRALRGRHECDTRSR